MDTLNHVQGLIARQAPRGDPQVGSFLDSLLESGAASALTPLPFVRPTTDDAGSLGQLAGELGIPFNSLTNLLPSPSDPSAPTTTLTEISLTTSPTTPSTTPTSSPSQSFDTATQTSTSSTSSSSASDSETSTPTSTPSPTDTATATPTTTPTPLASSDTSSSSSATSSSPSESATVVGAVSGHQSFIQNKALSIPVLTLSAIAALVLIIVLATWVVRRRRRNNVESFVEGISTDDLVGPTDIEKGDGLGFINGHSGGIAGGLGFGNRPPPTALVGMAGPQMYERSGPSVFPPPTAPPARGPMQTYGPSSSYRNMQAGYGQPSGPYPVTPYPGPRPQASHGHAQDDLPALTNPFDNPNGVYKTSSSYLPPVDPISPLSGALTRSTSNKGHRKPAPPALIVAVRAEASPPSAVSSHSSAASHDGNPMQLPSTMNPANPPPVPAAPAPVPSAVNPAFIALPPTPTVQTYDVSPVSPTLVPLPPTASPSVPQFAPTPCPGPSEVGPSNWNPKRESRHNSMLNSSSFGSSSEGHGSSESSHARTLDPTLPQLPVASPLPEAFGSREQRSPSPEKGKKKARQLKVVNQ